MWLWLFFSLAVAQEPAASTANEPAKAVKQADAPRVAPRPPAVTIYRHRSYIVETPKHCPTENGQPTYCLLMEDAEYPGEWVAAGRRDGGMIHLRTQSEALDLLSSQGWEIWNVQANGLKGAMRIQVRKPTN